MTSRANGSVEVGIEAFFLGKIMRHYLRIGVWCFTVPMTTRETKIMLYNAPASSVPASSGTTGTLDINMYHQGVIDAIGEGWTPVSHTLVPDGAGNLIVSILITREATVPDDLG